ncbi:TonB family protein [Erythrobacter donghaensis]|uniref:TonB family protein n=1 Tax=Erythrobacter donghaensis TaxID=267135 RepID=UPI001302C20D|nr:TonB family protein [Erythrobacter donghaensis]
MNFRILLAVAAGAAFTLPLAAQEPQPSVPRVQLPVEVRTLPPAFPAYRDTSEPRPDGSWSGWVTNADYPIESWQKGEAGTVEYTLAVDAEGKPTDCKITASTVSPTLEAETCRLLLERARFKPAQKPDGTPIPGTYSAEADWHRDQPEFAEPFAFKVAFTVDERGQIGDCRVLETSGTLPDDMQRSLDRRPCPGSTRGRGVPYRDAEGRPVAREVTMTVSADVTPVSTAQAED